MPLSLSGKGGLKIKQGTRKRRRYSNEKLSTVLLHSIGIFHSDFIVVTAAFSLHCRYQFVNSVQGNKRCLI